MKTLSFFQLFLGIVLPSIIWGQNTEKEIIRQLSLYNLKNAEVRIQQLPNSNYLKGILFSEYKYLEKGDLNESLLLSVSLNNRSPFEKSILKMYYADYLNRRTDKFTSQAYHLYLENLKYYKQKNDTLLIGETIKRILNHFQKYPKNNKEYFFYINDYKQYIQNSLDEFWYHYYHVSFRMNENFENHKRYYLTEQSFDSLQQYVKDYPYFQARIYHLKGLFCGNNMRNPLLYKENSLKAMNIYRTIPLYYAKKSLANITLNIGISDYKAHSYKQALQSFKSIEHNNYFSKELKLNIFLNDWLYKVYDELKNKDSADYYFRKKTGLENELKEQEFNISIHEIDTKYQIYEKEQKIKSQKKLLMYYENNKILYLTLIGLVFVLAAYSFIRWKKVDIRRKKISMEKESLEVEFTQTIEQLEKVKQLVIEDHIVLKNKAKVYLNELIYIKAEDHYLLLFTSKKKEFVRGKISEIIKELPPNFVQIHRSYIVNKNLITNISSQSVFLNGKIEIPLSRNLKKNI